MSFWYTFPLLGLAGLSLAMTAHWQHAGSLPTAPVPASPLCADREATRALDGAIAALGPQRVQWLAVRLRQRIQVAEANVQIDGTCLVGPGQRLRLDLQVDLGASRRTLQIVRNGPIYWQAERDRLGKWEAVRLDLKRVQQALEAPNASLDGVGEFQRLELLTGPLGMLVGLRKTVTFTRRVAIAWRGKQVVVLTGARASGEGWPLGEPRQCRLVLDQHSFWPYRLEWWGPVTDGQRDSLLTCISFREPVFNQPLAEQLFTLQSGQQTISDQTELCIQKIRGEPRR